MTVATETRKNDAGKPPVLCIVGPTASGKSALGVRVAKAAGGEILSADSMQVYRGMDIGTAKLTAEEMEGVPHHLLDMVPPDWPLTVAEWTQAADAVIAQLHAKGKLPIVVGGTGLYIRSIVEDLDFAGQASSNEVRMRWQAYLEAHGKQALHDALYERDPISADRLHMNDVRRVVRALEVFELRKRPLSEDYAWEARGGRYRVVQIGLTLDRDELYERVNTRVDQMMEQGLYEEVKGLLEQGYSPQLTSMQAIGYKELVQAVQGEMSLPEAVEQVKRATRRFVKRQLSWFRRDTRIHWFHVNTLTGINNGDFHRILSIASELTAGIPVQCKE